MSPVQEFIERVEAKTGRHGRKMGKETRLLCPAHEDTTPSLDVCEGANGKILAICRSQQCSYEAICASIGWNDHGADGSHANGNGRGDLTTPERVYDYVDEHGETVFQVCRRPGKQFRQRRPDGTGGWIWNVEGVTRVPFHLPEVLDAVRTNRTVYVVEGEKDVESVLAVGGVATCNAGGAGKWDDSHSDALAGAKVILIADRDEPGLKHAHDVAASLRGKAECVEIRLPASGKDVTDHLQAGLSLDDLMPANDGHAALSTGQAGQPDNHGGSRMVGANGRPKGPLDMTRTTPRLATEPSILDQFAIDLRLAGVAGEQRFAKLTYLCLTSRLLEWGKPTSRPVSMIGKGTSSTGKSHTQRTVLRFFPESAYFDLGSMSKRYLLYTEEPLSHRILVIPEWAVIEKDEEIVAVLRTLLSDGRLIHGTVTSDGKLEGKRIEKEGPTGLLMTTTATMVDPELETRCLADVTDDTPEQTRRVFEVLAELEDKDEDLVDWTRWHELQRWLEQSEHRVVIPYVPALARLFPNVATRMRRDFVSTLCLIRAHAILHQASRERDSQGQIIATIGDYDQVRELVDGLIAEGADAAVSPALRETVETVRRLLDGKDAEYVGMKTIVDALGVGRSAAYDRVNRALVRGYLVNVADKDERTKKIAIGGALPGEDLFLPSGEELVRAMSGIPSGQVFGSTNGDVDDLSGIPGRPGQGTIPHGQQGNEDHSVRASGSKGGLPNFGDPEFLPYINGLRGRDELSSERWLKLRTQNREVCEALRQKEAS
jgi:hypothetical protein